MAQSGAIDPQAAQQQIAEVQQQMQNPEEVEKMVAMQEMQLMNDLTPKITPQGEDPMQDPLVQIRMQELGVKQQDLPRPSPHVAASCSFLAESEPHRQSTYAASLAALLQALAYESVPTDPA